MERFVSTKSYEGSLSDVLSETDSSHPGEFKIISRRPEDNVPEKIMAASQHIGNSCYLNQRKDGTVATTYLADRVMRWWVSKESKDNVYFVDIKVEAGRREPNPSQLVLFLKNQGFDEKSHKTVLLE